jgi:hypothetical protein
MADDVADALGVDIIVPESSSKPSMKMPSALASFVGLGSRILKSEIVLGIREVSRPLQFESSYTELNYGERGTPQFTKSHTKVQGFFQNGRSKNYFVMAICLIRVRSWSRSSGER